jgi:ABC-type branched-subunit amino acid transport system permease subunit
VDQQLRQTMLSQMGIAIIACLAYNMLLGQGGMLSFGHAVYSGLGVPGHPHAQPRQRRASWRCRSA